MYEPEEVIFAPTGRCNLSCGHCRVPRGGPELGVEEARAFLRDCAAKGVARVGFSGGEPFLRRDFLAAIVREALSLDLVFDRLMTNAQWWRDEAELEAALAELEAAGFDGTYGLSVDAWHGSAPGKVAAFVRAASRIRGSADCVEFVSVRSPDDAGLLADLEEIAAELGAVLVGEAGEPEAILGRGLVEAEDETATAAEDAPEEGPLAELEIPVLRMDPSPSASELSWDDGAWFEDDRCAGPGQVLYVHPDGSVAVCCGFANEREALRIGRIAEGLGPLLARAAESPYVGACYGEGLSAFRARLEAEGVAFPGKTLDQCAFCDHLCAGGLWKRA